MRVVIVGISARAADAVGTLTACKAQTLAQAGHSVRVTLTDPRRVHPAVRPLLTRQSLRPLLRWADLVVFEFSQHLPALRWLPRLAKRGVRTLVDYHGITPPHFWPSAFEQPLVDGIAQRPLLRQADRIVTHSAFLRDELVEQVGCDARRVVVLDHPVGWVNAPPSEADLGRLPRSLPVPPARLILAVGRIAANKDLATLLHALARLRDDHPPIHAAIVGDASDLYALHAEDLRGLASHLGIRDRVHWLGQVSPAALAALIRRAEVLVSPSRHEGFCLPIREAQALGTPVVVARATAQPQTLGHAGLSFTPGDAAALAAQLRRVLAAAPTPTPTAAPSRPATVAPQRIAVVLAKAAGGLEKSLRLMAECLREAGRSVEVLVEPPSEQLPQRLAGFDAVLVGPYCWPTAQTIARALPAKTVLVGAWHDEPAAYTESVREAFANVGGLIFHSHAEAELVSHRLGLNHPNARVVGAYLPLPPLAPGPTAFAPRHAAAPRDADDVPYLLYCGRLIAEKNVPLLVEWMQRVQRRMPGRVRLCLVGAGNVPLPRCDWLHLRGPVSESEKARLIAGALAVVQLSCNESLSWVALEAQAAGVPVIAHRDCRVLADWLRRSGGGALVGSAAELTRTLRRALADPVAWHERGWRGRQWVAREYADRPRYTARLLAVIDSLRLPLHQQMRRAGLIRAQASDPYRWQAAWLALCQQTATARRTRRLWRRCPPPPVAADAHADVAAFGQPRAGATTTATSTTTATTDLPPPRPAAPPPRRCCVICARWPSCPRAKSACRRPAGWPG
jgi:glycosyltransferase involved in cell wall biosynthesis